MSVCKNFLILTLLATSVASAQVGVPVASNDTTVVVTRVPLQNVNDFQLNAKIIEQLKSNVSSFKPENYTIYSQAGRVTIQGRIKNASEADQVLQTILKVSGVVSVTNSVLIDPSL